MVGLRGRLPNWRKRAKFSRLHSSAAGGPAWPTSTRLNLDNGNRPIVMQAYDLDLRLCVASNLHQTSARPAEHSDLGPRRSRGFIPQAARALDRALTSTLQEAKHKIIRHEFVVLVRRRNTARRCPCLINKIED